MAEILLVEDDKGNRHLLQLMLEKLGHTVEVALDGEQAVAAVHRAVSAGRPPAAVLMDVHLPKLDGCTATTRIRELGHTDLPIIAVTAAALPGDRGRCLAAGMNDYLAKPLTVDELTRILAGQGVT